MAGGEVAALAATLLEGGLEPGLERFLVARSGGNPLFAQELAEMLRADGLIQANSGPHGVIWAPARIAAVWYAAVALGVTGTLATSAAMRIPP